MIWALDAQVAAAGRRSSSRRTTPRRCRPCCALCNEARVPVTAAAGRSGVCGASVPVFGGVLLDLTGLTGIVGVDTTSMLVDVRAGTFGDVFEDELRAQHGVTCGHWPQSMALSTVGGWVACRGAGQLSTRYGKIEDIVEGLDVVLADGTLVHTGGAPRAAVGPDLTQLFLGSEGTLGVDRRRAAARAPPPDVRGARRVRVRVVRRRARRDAPHRAAGRDARGAAPLRRDRGRPQLPDRRRAPAADARRGRRARHRGDAPDRRRGVPRPAPTLADVAFVEQWLGHRNDVSALEALISRGLVVDTMEIAGSWRVLPEIYARTVDAIRGVEHTMAASAHQSHSYLDGGCLYFTFAGRPPADEREAYYRAVWDAGSARCSPRAARSRTTTASASTAPASSPTRSARGFGVLQSVKDALDPNGILNPGKLGLRNPFGELAWP